MNKEITLFMKTEDHHIHSVTITPEIDIEHLHLTGTATDPHHQDILDIEGGVHIITNSPHPLVVVVAETPIDEMIIDQRHQDTTEAEDIHQVEEITIITLHHMKEETTEVFPPIEVFPPTEVFLPIEVFPPTEDTIVIESDHQGVDHHHLGVDHHHQISWDATYADHNIGP